MVLKVAFLIQYTIKARKKNLIFFFIVLQKNVMFFNNFAKKAIYIFYDRISLNFYRIQTI